MTVGVDRPGFFLPYRYAEDVRPIAYPALEPLFVAAEARLLDLLDQAESFVATFLRLDGPAPEPRFAQEWFPRLDAAIAYTVVRTRAPARIVEIGSGHSTRFLARAVRDGGLATRIDCIDPMPRATLPATVRHRACRFEDVDAAMLATEFGSGDLLFVDSSHLAMPGSDVDRVVNDLLPRLTAGILLHLHDIFLPDPYPAAWAWRGYNEQGMVGALLQGGAWRILWSSRWCTTRRADRLATSPLTHLPLAPDVPESSLWLEKLG